MGRTEQMKFASIVGGFGKREVALQKLVDFLEPKRSNTNVDTIPVDIWMQVKSRMEALGISQRQMASMRGTVYGGDAHFGFAPSRKVLQSYGTLLNAPDLLEIAQSDVFWDEIIEIEYDGKEDVYDMSVPGTHNFIADGLVVHNSLEQDADIVMFIHRPEMYEKDAVKQNIAQIKIAKHRNGPVGTIELVFRSALAKFENAATRHVDLSRVA
jgi:replicative DNA helicase